MRTDTEIAATLARQAGERLLEVRAQLAGATEAELRQAGDSAAQEFLAAALAQYAPGDAVLSEEAADDLIRLESDRVWIIDPLDGTREYAEGRDDFAVHVALWERGELVAGAVSLPARGQVFTTEPENGLPEPVGLRLAVSRSRAPKLVAGLVEQLGATTVPMGSAGVKVMAVVDGTVDAYVHAGGQYEWDSAAPVAVARAAGLHTSRIDGSPLLYNQANPYLPDLLICHTRDAARLLAAIAEFEVHQLEVQ